MCYRVEGAVGAGGCPADAVETAESYILGHLAGSARAVFEDHYLTCTYCAELVEETAHYVVAMQCALRRVRGNRSLPS